MAKTNNIQKWFGEKYLGIPLSVVVIWYVATTDFMTIMKHYLFLLCIGVALISAWVALRTIQTYKEHKDLFWVSTIVCAAFSLALHALSKLIFF